MLKWQRAYETATGVQVDYTGTGSGNGVQQLTHGSILFGCTDVPMTADQRKLAAGTGGEIVHIPLALGGVVPIYHLAAVPADHPLRFSGPVLADIFLGAIGRWNDPALLALNPGIILPDQPIRIVSRSDPSGTTAVFAEYLAKMRPSAWAAQNMGEGLDVSFAAGVRQRGNPGVAGEVARLDGAIGYVELSFAKFMNEGVSVAAVQNRAGRFVVASPENVVAAAAVDEVPTDLCFSIVDAPGPDAYPISGMNWAVFHCRLPGDRGRALVAFLRWVTDRDLGQRYTIPLGYAPLPDRVVARIGDILDSVQFE
jgi:phosphate transport system substrate-binding protein